MKTDRTQLTSVGQHRIWSLSDVLPEEEVFQSARIFRDGIAKPLLAEETPSFHPTTARSSHVQAMRVLTTSFYAGRKVFINKCKALHIVTQITQHPRVQALGSCN
jgi:hypothetical protein